MSICVARQPIFTGSLKVYGYELFFREHLTAYGDVSSDTATSETIINSFYDVGIDKMTSSRRAFVIFTEQLLLREVATLLPKEILVVEPERGIRPTDDVVSACQTLKERGYSFAFDDYVLEPEFKDLLPLADFIKIDFAELPADEIHRRLSRIDKNKVKTIAKKLENNSSLEMARSAGFTLFQGRFFCKPIGVNSEPSIPLSKLSCLQLINLSQNPDADYDSMAEIIKRDVALSYMLFRVVNSAYFGLLYTVSNIKHALTILGMAEIRKWITLISLTRLCNDKPSELITVSLTRARLMELLAPHIGDAAGADELFLIGLMSLMDALLDMPLEQVLKKTGISERVSDPLLKGTCERGKLLSLIIFYEDCDWPAAEAAASELKLTMDTVFSCYKEALKWAKRVT